LAFPIEIILITGPVNSGKSTALMKLVERERADGNSPTGIVAKGVFDNDRKIGFDIIDLSSDKIIPMARVDWQIANSFRIGRYIFNHDAFQSAYKALLNYQQNGVVFLDEAGPLELDGGGYAECLRQLLDADISRLYIVVRDTCVDDFIGMFLGNRDFQIKTIEDLN
jgi:nucleoside-triphosphatase THEP1